MELKLDINNIELAKEIVKGIVEELKPELSKSGQEDIIFDVPELANYLRVKKNWVYDKVHTEKIPFYKMGKYPRFRKSIIDKWLLEKEKASNKKSQNPVRRLLD